MKKMSEYFEIAFDPEETDSSLCIAYSPKGIDRYLTRMGTPVLDWPPDMSFFCESGGLGDYLCNPLGWFLLSERVQQALTGIAAEDVEFLPARVVEIQSGKELLGYSVMNIITLRDAFDPEHSIWLPYPHDKTKPSDTKKLAVRKEKTGGSNIFRLATQPYNNPIVTRRVKDELEEMGATGFWFIPLLS